MPISAQRPPTPVQAPGAPVLGAVQRPGAGPVQANPQLVRPAPVVPPQITQAVPARLRAGVDRGELGIPWQQRFGA